MKKYSLLIILLVFSLFIAKAQTFTAAFDPWDNTFNNGDGWAYFSNASNYLAGPEPPLLDSYLEMYKATKDIHYLEKFAIQATRVMERRDDYIGKYDPSTGYAGSPTGGSSSSIGVFNFYCGLDPAYITSSSGFGSPYSNTIFGYPTQPSGCSEILPDIRNLEADANGYLNGTPYQNQGRSMTWSIDGTSGADIACNQFYQPAQTFGICEQMAEFCYLLYADPDFNGLAGKTVPQEVQMIMHEPYTPTYPDWIYGTNSGSITTYSDFADWLYFHISQTYNYINLVNWGTSVPVYSPRNSNYQTETGYNTYPNFYNGSDGLAQINQQCDLGMVCIYLYYYETKVLGYTHTQDLNGPNFEGRAEDIGQFVYDQLQQNNGDNSNGYLYGGPSAWAWVDGIINSNSACSTPEDLNHCPALFQYADLLYRFQIPFPNTNSTTPIIKLQDMQWLANDFARDVALSPSVTLPANSSNYSGLNSRWSLGVCGIQDIYGACTYDDQYMNSAVDPVANIGPMVFLTAYNPYIYAEVLNDYSYAALYYPSKNEVPIYSVSNNQAYTQLALFENGNIYDANGSGIFGAYNYSTYKNIFNPVAVYPDVNPSSINNTASYSYTPISWSAATSGNYDGSGTVLEFVSSKLNTQTLYMNEIQTSDHSIGTTYNQVSGIVNLAGYITNLTSGNYSGGGIDYVAATDGNNIDIDKLSGNAFASIFSTTPVSLPSSFSGNANLTTVHCDNSFTGDEVLAIDQNGDGFILELTGTNTYKTWASIPGSPPFFQNSVGITTGYFDGISNGQEVATIDFTGNLIIYTLNFNPLNSTFSATMKWELYDYNAGNAKSNGLTSGDFDGSGQDQIILHSNYDGRFIVFKVKSGSITEVGSQAFPDGDWMAYGALEPNFFKSGQKWQNGIMTVIKNFPGTPGDALATFRNCDGRIMVFGIQGECESQSVIGDYFINVPPNLPAGSAPNLPPNSPPSSPPNNCTTVVSADNNPYSAYATNTNPNDPLDYNANNTLTASNDIVSSGTYVQFSAGNAVLLKSGFNAVAGSSFDANIKNYLSCSNEGFFLKSPPIHSSPSYQAETNNDLKNIVVDSLNILVKQSVTQGQFSVGLNKIDSSELNQPAKVTVYNMLAQPLYENTMMVVEGNTLPINLSNQPKGIYLIIIRTKDRVLHGKVILQ